MIINTTSYYIYWGRYFDVGSNEPKDVQECHNLQVEVKNQF